MLQIRPSWVVHFSPEQVVHIAPDLLVHFSPEYLVHFTADYSTRLASGPVSRQMGKELWPPQRFFDRYLYAKNARRLCSQKILALAQ